jgi:hypothetical protein
MRTKSNEEIAEPILAADRRDKLEPRLKKSNTLNVLPNRLWLKIDMLEPICWNDRIERALP